MNEPLTKRPMRNDLARVKTVSACLKIALLLVAITLPGIYLAFNTQQVTSTEENRVLQGAPAMPSTLAELNAFPGRFDAFSADRFGFKQPLVKAYNKLHLALGTSPNERVILGRDDWLFLNIYELTHQNRGAAPYSRDVLQRTIEALRERQDYIESRGVGVLYVPIPDKQSIYPEYLPASITIVGKSRYLQFLEALPGSGINYVDVYSPLMAAKGSGSLYRRGGSHWNCRGAWLAFSAIGAEIAAANIPGTNKIRKRQVRVIEKPSRDLPDMATNYLAMGSQYMEPTVPICSVKNRRQTVAINMETGAQDEHGYLARPQEQAWLHARADGVKRSRVLVFRDSFSNALLQYFLNTFDEVIYISHDGMAFDPAVIDEYQPDYVVFAFVERFLHDNINNRRLAPDLQLP